MSATNVQCTTHKHSVLVVLVQFPDKSIAPNAAQRFQELFFSVGAVATGSVIEYYTQVSHSLINLTGEVLGPYNMPQTLAQYANGASGLGTNPPNVRKLGDDAFAAAKAQGDINWSQYDNDSNGYVDVSIPKTITVASSLKVIVVVSSQTNL